MSENDPSMLTINRRPLFHIASILAGYLVGFILGQIWYAPIKVQFALAVFTLGFGPFWLIAGAFVYSKFKGRIRLPWN